MVAYHGSAYGKHMKTILFLILASIASAAPVVEIKSLSLVTVDGIPKGSVVDVLANTKDDSIRGPLLDALIAREKAVTSDSDQKNATAIATAKSEADTAKADATKARAILDAAQAALTSPSDATKRAEAIAKIAEARRTAKDTRLAEIDAQLSKLNSDRVEAAK